jgi:hypothetical protein
MLYPKNFVFYSPVDSDGGAADDVDPVDDIQQDQDAGGDGVPGTWDEYLTTLDDTAKSLYDTHIAGLTNTVKATREERDTFKARLSEVIQQLDGKKPGQVREELEKLETDVAELSRRSQFFEEAASLTGPDRCSNVRLAWMTANADSLFKRDGSPDWDAIKEVAPEIFGMKVPNAHSGDGTKKPLADKPDPNAVLRRMAGMA